MVKLGEYKSFLQFVKERTPEIKDLVIEINYGDEFSCTNILGDFYIDVESELTKDVNQYTGLYFSDKINQDVYWLQPYYNEFFVLLHEIGHIVTRKLITTSELQQNYKDLKSKTFNSYYQAFKENRSIIGEKLADNFAIEFTNKYFYEIGKYFTNMSESEINEFLGIIN